MHKVNAKSTETHHEQQNLQFNSCSKKAFGAWICNHSKTCHLTANPKTKAADNETMAVQQTNSITPSIFHHIPKVLQTENRRMGALKTDCQFH